MRLLFCLMMFAAFAVAAAAQDVADIAPRPGWSVTPTDHDFDELVSRVRSAAGAGGLAVVTMAGPTEAAAGRGIDIPGNRVIGLFSNDYAVRILPLSTAAMIEAPIRLYVTEDASGTATLSYRLPSQVLAPYIAEAPALGQIAAELDADFAAVAEEASR